MKLRLLVTFSFIMLYFPLRAQSFYFDEDLSILTKFTDVHDQNYTMGLGFGIGSRQNDDALIYRPGMWLARKMLGKRVENNKRIAEIHPGWALNGTAFTPDDLRAELPVTDDRPYAFILYLSTKQIYLDVIKNKLFTSEFNYGFIGTQVGKAVQTSIHRWMNDGNTHDPYLPEGWHNQISNGGEPIFMYSLSTDKLLTTKGINTIRARQFFELKHGTKFMLGYYTGVNYHISARIGLLDARNWIRNLNPLEGGQKNPPTTEEERKIDDLKSYYLGKKTWEFFIFGSYQPTFMVYNELLNGGLRKPAHAFSFSESKHFINEWYTGIGVGIPCGNRSYNLSWIINAGRSKEFKTALGRTHTWGGLNLSWPLN